LELILSEGVTFAPWNGATVTPHVHLAPSDGARGTWVSRIFVVKYH